MSYAAILGAAIAVSGAGPERPAVEDLLNAFRTLCLVAPAPLDRLAEATAAAGYRRVAIESAPMTHVTAAWERNGVLVFERAEVDEPAWPSEAMCGVSADLGRVGNQRRLINTIAEGVDAYFLAGARGDHGANLALLREGAFVSLDVNGSRRAHTTVTLLAHQERDQPAGGLK
jgi:hypothetical protein